MGMADFLKRCDMYFMPVKLRFMTRDVHRTPVGGFFSILLIIVFFCIAYFFSKDVFERQQPENTSIQKNELMPKDIQFSPNQFPVAFGIMDYTDWKFFIDETIYFAEVKIAGMKQKLSSDNSTYESEYWEQILPAERCLKEKHFNNSDFDQYLNNIELNNLYCFDYDQFDPIVGGNYDMGDYTSILIQFKTCHNSNDPMIKQRCQSPTEVNEQLSQFYAYFYYSDYSVDVSDYQNPFHQYITSFWTVASNKNPQFLQLSFKWATIFSDVGFLFEDIESKSQSQIHSQRDMTQFNDNTFLFINIEAAQTQNQYTRRYKQIQKVFAEIGGFMKIASIIVVVLIYFFVEVDYNSNLVNEIFFFQDLVEEGSSGEGGFSGGGGGGGVDSDFKLNSRDTPPVIIHIDQEIAEGEALPASILSPKNEDVVLKVQHTYLIDNTDIQCQLGINRDFDKQKNLNSETVSQRKKNFEQNMNNDLTINLKSRGMSEPGQGNFTNREIEAEQKLQDKKNDLYDNTNHANTNIISKHDDLKQFGLHCKIEQLAQSQLKNSILKNSLKKEVMAKEEQDELEKLTQNQKGGLKLSFWEKFLYRLPCKKDNKNSVSYKKSLQILQEKIDLIYIINQIVEIDQLKFLIFSDDQLKLFDYIPRPEFSLKSESLNPAYGSISNQSRSPEDIVSDAFEAFCKISDSGSSQQSIDAKLLQTMNPNIKNLFTDIKNTRDQCVDKSIVCQQNISASSVQQYAPLKVPNSQHKPESNDIELCLNRSVCKVDESVIESEGNIHKNMNNIQQSKQQQERPKFDE